MDYIKPCKSDIFDKTYEIADNIESEEQKPCEDIGEISDELYYQRAVLFATIVNLKRFTIIHNTWKFQVL